MRIAIVGLGKIGFPIAARIKKSFTNLTVLADGFNSPSIFKHANLYKTLPCKNFNQFYQNDYIVSVLPNSHILKKFINDTKHHITDNSKPKIWIDCTSGDPTITREISDILEKHNIKMIDAPISGGPTGAEQGKLCCIVGGEKKDVEECRPILETFVSNIIHVGNISSGHSVKSMNNILNMTHLMIASECLIALKKMNIDPKEALKAINNSSGRSLQTTNRIPEQVFTREFAYGFDLELMYKDVKIATEILEKYNPDSGIISQTLNTIDKHIKNKDIENYDYTEIIKFLEESSNIELN